MSIPEGQCKRPRPTLKIAAFVALLALSAFLGTSASTSFCVRADDSPASEAAAVETDAANADVSAQHKNIVQKRPKG